MKGGQPLKFLALILFGWVGLRGYALWRDGGAATLPQALASRWHGLIAARAAPLPRIRAMAAEAADPPIGPHRVAASEARFERAPPPPSAATAPSANGDAVPIAAVDGPQAAIGGTAPAVYPGISLVLPPRPVRRRLAGSAWLIARGGDATGLPGGQLGGSQAGVRLTYPLDARHRLALASRVSAPLSGRGAEAAFGLDWQPLAVPLHLVAERRVGLDGGPAGTMLGVIGGFGPLAVRHGVTVEGYGQAGVMVRAAATERFVDGALRVAHPVARTGGVAVDFGVGTWGGAQRGAARLDVGPSLALSVPVAGRRIRLAADWRQRLAGSARPGSGPALSLGTDF